MISRKYLRRSARRSRTLPAAGLAPLGRATFPVRRLPGECYESLGILGLGPIQRAPALFAKSAQEMSSDLQGEDLITAEPGDFEAAPIGLR